jgi:hypothetical protein
MDKIMIFEIVEIRTSPFDGEEYTKETLMITTYPNNAWHCLEKALRREQASEIILRYWYSTGKLRSSYIISMTKWTVYLYDGEETPTIRYGIKHYMNLVLAKGDKE